MVSAFTPNIQLEEPARGDDVGTWDTPVNSNMTLLDLVCGGTVNITLNNSPVVLSAAQFQCAQINFVSTLSANVTITFPATFSKPYIIQNQCTGSSAFTVTLQTTIASAEHICAPPGEMIDVMSVSGGNLKYRNLDRIGAYWDYAGSSVPAWVTGCTVPPYLNCDGSTFSSAVYPQLANILGGTTLPDARGRNAFYLNQGTARLSSGGAGINGNTVLSVGGGDGVALKSSNIPTLTSSGTNTTTVYPNGSSATYVPIRGAAWSAFNWNIGGGGSYYGPTPPIGVNDINSATAFSGSNNVSVTYTNASPQAVGLTAPAFVAGLRLIRAA